MKLEIPEKLAKDEWEKLPDAQKPIFRQSEGDPNMYEYGVPAMHNSMRNAKTERETEKQKREAAEQALSAYRQFGDPDKFEDLSRREQALIDGSKSQEQAWAQAKKEADERYQAMLGDAQKKIKELEGSRCTDHQGNIIRGLLAGARVKKGYETAVLRDVQSYLKTELRDGKPFTYVVDENGAQAKDPDTFDPMTPERFFSQYRQGHGALFDGDTGDASGSGFSNGRGGGADTFDGDPKDWTFDTKKAFLDSHGGPQSETARAAYQRKLDAWATKRRQQQQQQRKAS